MKNVEAPLTSTCRARTFGRTIRSGLAGTLLLAALLRFVGLPFGADTVLTPRSDEEIIRLAALHSLTGDLNPHYAVWGHLFHNLYVTIGAIYMGATLALCRAGHLTEAIAQAHCVPTTFVMLGRAISATAGTLTLIPTYLVARRLFQSRLIGLGSCVLLASAFLHVRDSHFATTDILATLTGTCALAATLRPGSTVELRRSTWAGVCTGIALATKLSTAALVPTFCTLALLGRARERTARRALQPVAPAERERAADRIGQSATPRTGRWASIATFLAAAAASAAALQPFMLLDPMQTIYGIFGDILGPARRPIMGGFDYHVPAVMLHYYLPQSLGWLVGSLAVGGGMLVALWPRTPHERRVIVFLFWMLLPLVTVRQTYLRYMDPLLPVACVLAAVAIERGCRFAFVPFGPGWLRGWTRVAVMIIARCRDSFRRCVPRGWTTAAVMLIVAVPNLYRGVQLDSRLCREDTRTESKRWIESNVPTGSRIAWVGFGNFAPHLSMPWLYATARYDRELKELRARHGLSNAVEHTITDWKIRHRVPTYDAVAVSPLGPMAEVPGYVRFPFLPRSYDVPVARQIDAWGRRTGLLNDQTPYDDLMRRYLAGWSGLGPDELGQLREPWLVVTRLPPHLDLVDAVGPEYELMQTFSPGWHGNPADEHDMLYDWNDAWWLPNIGIARADRPGPEIRIYRLREKR